MSNSSPKKKKASSILLDDYDSPNSSTKIPQFNLDLNEGDPFKELNQVLSGEPTIESIHSSGRKRSHTIGSKPQPDQVDMVAELTSLRNQNTPLKVTSNEESEDKSSKFSSRLFGFRKKSNEEKNKKKNRRKSMEVSKTEKKPINTIKIHYQRQDSGTAKVLPLFDNDDARTIINTMLKKLSLLGIEIGDDLYQLQAITKEGVHIFADNEKPYQWMKKHSEIEFVCCKILIPLKSPRPTSTAPPPPTPATPLAQSPARVDPTPSLPASNNVPRVTNIEALSDSDMSSESYSVSESDDDTPIVSSSPRRASGLSALVAAVSSNSVRGDIDLSKLPSVLSASHRSLKAHKPNSTAPPPPPLTPSTSSQTAPAVPPLPASSNVESSDTSTHEYDSDDSYSDDVLGDDKEEMFRAALELHASTVVKRSSGQYDEKLINHLRKSLEKKPASPEAQIAKRVELIKELVDTERTYVRSLVFVEKSYITPIRQQKLMSEEDLNVVFSNLQTILAVHRELMSDLGARFYAATDSAPLIGDVFVHFSPFLKLYSTYYKQFDRADQTLKKCLKKSSKLRDFCQQVKSGPASRGLDLVSYLIMPVQRLPRYVLLLSQLLDLTDEHHSDFEPLTEALDKMQVVTKQADEALPPPPTTQAAKALTALGDQFHELLSVAKNRDHGEVGNADSNSSESPLLLYGTAFEWDDGDCDDGSVVRLWLLQRWLVVAGGEKNDAALGVDGKPIGKKRGLFSVTPPAREPLRIPLSTIWVKRITWSDGRFEILSPLAEHSFFLEMNPHDRERWVNQIAKLTKTSNLSPSQIAERSLVDVQRVYDNQKHTASAWELKDLKREMETKLATIASIGQAHDTDQVEAYKTFIGERYAGRQRDTIQMFKKRSRSSRASSRRTTPTPTTESPLRPKSPRKSPRSPHRLGKELSQPSLATASSTGSTRPTVCQRCNQHRVAKSVRDKATKKRVYVCRACAAELPSRGSWHK